MPVARATLWFTQHGRNVFVFKRGMIGVYQHCGETHVHRYLAEFDFRYNRRANLSISEQSAPPIMASQFATSALPIGGLMKPVTPKQYSR